MICRLAIPPNSKDFPTRPGITATCSRCKRVAFGGIKHKIEPIPKFPTACNAPLAEKMTKLRKAQAYVRRRSRAARAQALGIRRGKVSASAPSSPSPRSPMPPSPSSLPPRSPGNYMPRSPAGSLPPPSPNSMIRPHSPSGSLPPRSPGYLNPRSPGNLPPRSPGSLPPRSPGSLPPRSPGNIPPHSPGSLPLPSPGSYSPHSPGHPPRSPNAKSPHTGLARSPYGLQPRSPMSLPARSPCSSMPPSPQAPCYSYPASPNIGARTLSSPIMMSRQMELESLRVTGISLSEKQQAELNHLRRISSGDTLLSPRHPGQHEQSPASSTSSERLSLPPGREQDDTTIRALLQLSRPGIDSNKANSRGGENPNVPVMVLQRGLKPGSTYPHPFMVPTSLQGDLPISGSSSMPGTPTIISTAGGHYIPVLPTSVSSSLPNAIPPGYPTAALPFLVQPFSPGAIRYPNLADKPSPRSSEMYSSKPGQPQYRNKVPNQEYGSYATADNSETRPDSIVIVGTNCAGSSSITVGNDPKDNFLQVQPPPSFQDSNKLNDLYGKPGFHAFYCSCSGRRIMLLQCPDCDFLCNNLFGMELHIAAQRHAESRTKVGPQDGPRYARDQETPVSKYGGDQDDMQDTDEVMSQSSIDTQSVDMDMDMPSPRNPREVNTLLTLYSYAVLLYTLSLLENDHDVLGRRLLWCFGTPSDVTVVLEMCVVITAHGGCLILLVKCEYFKQHQFFFINAC